MLHCLKFAFRRIARRPYVSLSVSLLLGVGIGLSSGILTVTASILYRPLPFPDSERLVQVGASHLAESHQERVEYFSYAQFLDLRALSRSFESLTAVKEAGRGDSVTLTGGDEPLRLRAALATSDFFPTLAVRPVIGRTFLDWSEGESREVILSHGLWSSGFSEDPKVVGRKILLNQEPYVVVGVMPAFLDRNGSQIIQGRPVDLWLPLSKRWLTPGEVAYRIIGRLKTGVTPLAANQELMAVAGREETKWALWRGATPNVTSLREEVISATRRYLQALSLSGLILLVLACANSAGLLLSRVEQRQREAAIQSALGASRRRLAAEAFGEASLLVLGGFALSLLTSLTTVRVFKILAPRDVPRLDEIDWLGGGLEFAAVLSLACGLLMVLVLLRQSAPRRLSFVLKGAADGGGPLESRFRRNAIMVETAAAVALLFSAALLYQSFNRLSAVDPGFQGTGVLVFDVFLPDFKFGSTRRGQAPLVYEAIREEVEALPGVAGVSFTSSPPLAERDYFSSGGWRVRRVDDRYFDVLRTPIVEGNGLSATPSGRKEALVSQSLANSMFPNRSAIGARIEEYEIVGVVADVRHRSLDEPPEPALYVSYREEPDTRMSLLVRSSGPLSGLANLIRGRVRSLYPDQPISTGVELEQLANQSAAILYRRLFLALLGVFSLAALTLSATGFYALITQFVDRQARRLGIRMALGATPRDILVLTLSQTWRLVWMGSVLGLAGTFWLSELQRALLFETSPYDLATLLFVLVVVLAVASAGGSIPAVRAAKLHPAEILRVG